MNPLVPMLALAAATAVVADSTTASDGKRGEAMFLGNEPLVGAIRGHRTNLPPEVVRCRNCHNRGEQKAPGQDSAPPIGRSLLLKLQRRRGGPPSSYDPASFCKLLRTGVDPAYILISRVMPAYVVDDAQCESLWEFLVDRKGTN
jgi:hypothetical protein